MVDDYWVGYLGLVVVYVCLVVVVIWCEVLWCVVDLGLVLWCLLDLVVVVIWCLVGWCVVWYLDCVVVWGFVLCVVCIEILVVGDVVGYVVG